MSGRFGMLFLSVAALPLFAAQPWDGPAVNAENRLEARAYLPPEKPFVMSLDGRGVRFTAVGAPMMIQALHFMRDDLDQSRHRPGDCRTWSEPRRYNPLVPRKEVRLSLDCHQTGLGCNNCGPIPLPQYRFKVEPTTWSYEIAPSS